MSTLFVRAGESSGLDELESLGIWLADSHELRSSVSFVPKALGPGEMGGGLEVLEVALASGGALTILAAAIGEWVTLPRKSAVHIKISSKSNGDGGVEINTLNVQPEKVEEILRACLEE